jgi:DedD protein
MVIAPKVEHKSEPKPEPAKPETVKPEHKDTPKAEHKEPKPEPRAAEKEKEKAAVKPKADEKAPKPHDDTARALAILEGKQAEKAAEKERSAESGSQKYVLQVAAMSSAEKAAEVQAKLREAGISSYTQKTTTPSGELIRVRVGPLNKEDAEKVRAKLGRLGMSGAMTPV